MYIFYLLLATTIFIATRAWGLYVDTPWERHVIYGPLGQSLGVQTETMERFLKGNLRISDTAAVFRVTHSESISLIGSQDNIRTTCLERNDTWGTQLYGRPYVDRKAAKGNCVISIPDGELSSPVKIRGAIIFQGTYPKDIDGYRFGNVTESLVTNEIEFYVTPKTTKIFSSNSTIGPVTVFTLISFVMTWLYLVAIRI